MPKTTTTSTRSKTTRKSTPAKPAGAVTRAAPARPGFIQLTRAGTLEVAPVFVSAAHVVLVEPSLAPPGVATPPGAGATLHLMGQPAYPLFVNESAQDVLDALAR